MLQQLQEVPLPSMLAYPFLSVGRGISRVVDDAVERWASRVFMVKLEEDQ
jgi:hypothetical protein